ncbi:MAG: aldehyde dehydrogenase [Gammaproteobacteria bacterium]|nr:aldehyde dehydrogenase [Gammaproteobacteria bacterium]MDH4310328.1 aldehyde dehydrogenase [Gammaproteobacteria bacterium]MDH5272235.1 aldehyde dehydrogenase [Gammaproteobacteria bacterium]
MNQTAPPTAQDWRARAAVLPINGQAFIDGRYVDAASGATFDDVTPIDGRVIARVASTDQADVERAVAAARRAFDSGAWSRQPPRERKRVLQRFAELILAHRDELALLETLDMGKPISDSLAVDIPATARCIAWYAEAVDKVYDEVAPTAHDQLALITREPIGVVAAIVPWNFPLIMAAWKIGPALAAGNSFVLKPSEKSPLSAIRLAALAAEAGIPDGVFNVLPGYGHTAGQALALHMDVDCIGFTGSTRTGKLMLQYSGQSNMKRVWLECGGKSPNIILADCPDLDRAAATAAGAIFFNQGEMCTAASRLIVEASVRDRVLEKVVEASRAMQPGDPLDPATRMGAIVDEIQTRTVLGYIDSGRSEGASVLAGGQRVREQTGGCYIEPTVFADVQTDMRIAREEIFGPVLAAITVQDAEEAVRVGNGVEYGLAAAVWTRDIGKAHRIAKALRAGMVYVNCYDADDITVPFGGFKQSGIGRDKSLHAFDKYTELKTTWIDLSQ